MNLVARASGEGRAMVRPPNNANLINNNTAAANNDVVGGTGDLTARERDICSKFVKLIQYHPSKENRAGGGNGNNNEDTTPSGQGADKLITDALANSSQHE